MGVRLRVGTLTPWVFGSDRSLLSQYAWFLDNSNLKDIRQQRSLLHEDAQSVRPLRCPRQRLRMVRGPQPSLSARGWPPVDDSGGNENPDRKVVDSDIRIYRGGSFADLPLNLRSAYRDAARPTNRLPAIGFRVVRTYVPERAEAIQAR